MLNNMESLFFANAHNHRINDFASLRGLCLVLAAVRVTKESLNMSQNDVYAEWQKLCEEQEKAREAYFKDFSSVNQKFAAFAQGVSNKNPNNNELSKFDEAWKAWEDVKNRMHQFAKDNA
jgi:hypothetical protein